MKQIIRKTYWLLSTQFGVDPRRMMRSIMGILRYIKDWRQFRKGCQGRLDLLPCLYDWYEEGGSTKDEYFLQDLHVARKIHRANPEKHVDIGSRIDGFVAHLASFREIEVFDIRPISSQIPGVTFRQADLMIPAEEIVDCCDSLSCLHALEHFGLGRYGDPIDPNGYISGLNNMVKILRAGGLFYLSVPIGKERVEFNAHRIFSPSSLLELAAKNNLTLREFSWIGADRILIQSSDPQQDLRKLGDQAYALGIFTFVKQ